MSKRQPIARNAVFLVIEPITFGVVSIIVAGYVARSIGTVEYGKLSFSLAFINFLTLFTNLGFNNYLMNLFASDPSVGEKEFFPIVLVRTCFSLLTYGIGCILINLLNYPLETREIFYAAGLTVIPLYLTDSCEGVFKGMEKMHYIAATKLFNSLLLHLLRCTVVYMGYKAYGLAWIRVLVAGIGTFLCFSLVYKHFLKFRISFSLSTCKKIIIGTLPFAFSTSFLIIYNRIDILILSYIAGDEPVAYFKTANLFTEHLSVITVAVVGAVYPAISRLFLEDREKAVWLYRRTFIYLSFISFPIAIGGVMLSNQFILLIFGIQYMPSAEVAKILFICIPIIFTTSIMGNVLMAINKAKAFTYITIILCAASVFLDLLLIPTYQHVGAALSTLIAQSINIILLAYLTSKMFGTIKINAKLFKIICSSVIMGFVIYLSGDQNLFFLFFIGVTTYFVSIMVLRTFHKEELIEIKNMLLRKRRG